MLITSRLPLFYLKKAFCLFVFFAALTMLQGQEDYRYNQLEKLPDFINSPFSEITPVSSRDGNTLFFTRTGSPDFDRTLFLDSVDMAKKLRPEVFHTFLADVYTQIAGYSILNPETSAFNQDVWIAEADSFRFTRITHPGAPLNNALPNSIVTITPDPNTFYCINQFKPTGDMDRGFSYIRRNPDNLDWSFPDSVYIEDYYTLTSDVNLTMSFDGKILILSAMRSDAVGDMDLYVCFKKNGRSWSAPKHLGNVVNSAYRETTPFLSEDNTTLYFSSNRKGAAGQDIYRSVRIGPGWEVWSAPTKLDAPINSKADEAQPYFNMSSGFIYFTSTRDGNSDIFRVRIAPPQERELLVKGRVLNRKTRALISDATLRYGAEGNPFNTLAAPNGTYSLKILRAVKFSFQAEKPGYNGKIETVFFPLADFYFREQYVDVYLDPLETGAKIELQPIFFVQSKSEILDNSISELDRLASTLQENPELHIRVEGHTDNQGRSQDLLRLSEARAEAIKAHLIQKGILPQRISTKGFGAAQPLNDNSTDELRSQNRRVEIRITKI
jgi:outer membrane protein OmpA-like peptidoglycan-associated protein